jgi:hypothetical protein
MSIHKEPQLLFRKKKLFENDINLSANNFRNETKMILKYVECVL